MSIGWPFQADCNLKCPEGRAKWVGMMASGLRLTADGTRELRVANGERPVAGVAMNDER
jgi:hypothetical protein